MAFFGRTTKLLGMAAVTMAAVAVTGPAPFAVGAAGSFHAARRAARKHKPTKPSGGYPTFANKGTWTYNGRFWSYHDMASVWDGEDSAYHPDKGTLNFTSPLVVSASGPITAVSTEVLGKNSVLKAANVYTLNVDGKTATFVRTLPAPRGADEVTLSAAGGPTSGVQTVTFGKNGIVVGQVADVPLDDFVDVAVHANLSSCSAGLLSPPVVVVPTVQNDPGSTGVGGFPIADACHHTWSSHVKIT